jgi:cation diffusion facilitator CzcD-associated flavoprotein CzcO
MTAASANILTNWEEKVDEILGAETDDTNKVKQLFVIFPNVPDEAKAEVAQHLSNLTSDADYAALGELLKDPKLPDATLDVLMADALNRPNSVKLPELLDVAKTPEHPKADEAKDILALFLDEDFGTDWGKWQEKMTAWLKDNPD